MYIATPWDDLMEFYDNWKQAKLGKKLLQEIQRWWLNTLRTRAQIIWYIILKKLLHFYSPLPNCEKRWTNQWSHCYYVLRFHSVFWHWALEFNISFVSQYYGNETVSNRVKNEISLIYFSYFVLERLFAITLALRVMSTTLALSVMSTTNKCNYSSWKRKL